MGSSDTPQHSSLLEETGIGDVAPVAKGLRWDRKLDAAIRVRVRAALRRRAVRRGVIATAALVLIAGGIGAYFMFRPVPKPDFQTADVDVLFNYTLLTDEFNHLSIDERIELLSELVQRLKSIDADQSLLMAAFFAQIQGELRDQLEKNVSLLAVDVFDSYAKGFNQQAPPDVQKRYVEGKFIEFQKTLERIAGEERDISDEDRLIEGRREAQRDLKHVRSGKVPLESAVRMISFLDQGVGQHASGQQKIRIASLMSHMIKTLREGEVPPEPEKPGSKQSRGGVSPPRGEEDASSGRPAPMPAVQPEKIGPSDDVLAEEDALEKASDPEQQEAEEPSSSDDDEDAGGP